MENDPNGARGVRVEVYMKWIRLTLVLMILVTPTVLSRAQGRGILGGSQGPLADSCGVPPQGAGNPAQGARGTPVFPAGQYPVKLPAVSLLGAHNDLPDPFQVGVHWGQLPEGRKWGSTPLYIT